MQIKAFTLPVVVVLISSGMVACSSDGDIPVADGAPQVIVSGENEDADPMVTPDFRVVSVLGDRGADGEVDVRYAFSYDADGRVTTVTSTPVDTSTPVEIVTHSYDGDMLVQRTTNEGNFTNNIFYRWESGRLMSIETDFAEDNVQLGYDASGRLNSVVGDVFQFDNDCDAPPTPVGSNPGPDAGSLPRYSIEYDSAGRFLSAIGDAGDSLVMTYRSDGQPATMSAGGECSSAGNATTTFTYNSDNLLIMARTRYPAAEEELFEFDNDPFDIDVEYDQFDRPLVLTTTTYLRNGTPEVDRQSYTYNDNGLVLSVLSELSGGFENGTVSSLTTFEYEEQSCIEQINASPVRALLTNFQALVRSHEEGLRCGFFDDLL